MSDGTGDLNCGRILYMKNLQKGSSSLVVVILIVLGIGVIGGGYVLSKNKQQQKILETPAEDLQKEAANNTNNNQKTVRDYESCLRAGGQEIWNNEINHCELDGKRYYWVPPPGTIQ